MGPAKRKQRNSSIITQHDSASDIESDGGDNVSVISESFGQQEGGSNLVRDRNYICGYLLKKNLDGAWQKRFFETNGPFLTYYKSKKRSKLLAALNIKDVFRIVLVIKIFFNLFDLFLYHFCRWVLFRTILEMALCLLLN